MPNLTRVTLPLLLNLTAHVAQAQSARGCDGPLTANLRARGRIELDEPVPLPWSEMHPNKVYLYRRVLGADDARVDAPALEFAKYRLIDRASLADLPVAHETPVTVSPSIYDYRPAPADAFHVYVNFADPELFSFWASGLFAQDELQVAEHPALAAVREHALIENPFAMTLDVSAREVALVRGVPRLAEISTDLYGHAFAYASPREIDVAVRTFSTPSLSNILAMAARAVPAGQHGRPYEEDDVSYHLYTALTGFTAARAAAGARRLVIHTGNWGTGAFGNDPEVMALVQITAARAAGVDELIYHAVSPDRAEAARRALHRLDTPSEAPGERPRTLGQFIRAFTALGRPYGRGNGT